MEAITIDDFNEIKHLVPSWIGLKASGSIQVTHTDKLLIEKIYVQIYQRSFCKHCPEAVAEAFTSVMREYDRRIKESNAIEPGRIKRARISDMPVKSAVSN